MDVLTRRTNFIGFIEFYEPISHAVPAVFHCLLISRTLKRLGQLPLRSLFFDDLDKCGR